MKRGTIDYVKILIISVSVASFLDVVPALANTSSFYSSNNIFFYDSSDTGSCSSVSVFTGTLPSETVTKLEGQEVQQKAAQNKARYDYAEQQTGVPWQILAAMHYREGGMDSDKSIADGSSLSAGTSKDGLPIDPDPNKDAANAADHLKDMGESVYELSTSAIDSWNFDNWAYAFLAYNRGAMYKMQNEPYTKSPYVMNYIDTDHINMPWIHADSYEGTKKWNGLYDNGTRDSQVGAMAVASYLGFNFDSPGSTTSSNCSGPGGIYGDIVATAVQLSWSDRSHSVNDPKPEYVAAMEEVGLTNAGCGPNGADCGVFVATVMRASGADKEFPIGTDNILKYLRDNQSYAKIEASDTSGLMPGDIFIISGHTMMYVGDGASDGGKSMASASCSERIGDRGANIYFSDHRGAYEIYRKI